MKNSRSFADLASLALALSVLAAGQATAQTWTGNTDALWDTDTNWSDTPPNAQICTDQFSGSHDSTN